MTACVTSISMQSMRICTHSNLRIWLDGCWVDAFGASTENEYQKEKMAPSFLRQTRCSRQMAQPHNKAHRECILIEYSPGNCQQPNNASRIYSIAIRAEHVVGGSKNARHRRCALCVWNSSEKLYGIFSLFPSPSVHVYLFDLIFILMTVSHPGD